MSYELHIPEKKQRNNKGQFVKGHTPHSSGLKWADYMDGRTARKVLRLLKENSKNNIPPNTSRKVVAIKNGKLCGVFKSATLAAKIVGVDNSVISHVCAGRRKTAKGYQWFFEDSEEWLELINK